MSLDQAEWLNELVARYYVQEAISGKSTEEEFVALQRVLQAHGLLKNVVPEVNLGRCFIDSIWGAEEEGNPLRALGVRPLLVEECLRIQNSIPRSVKKEARRWSSAKLNGSPDLAKPLRLNFPVECFAKWKTPTATVVVDLDLPECDIIMHFKNLVRELKENKPWETSEPAVRKQDHGQNWYLHGVLPYLDITQWLERTGQTIVKAQLANWLFSEVTDPKVDDADSTKVDKIRQTTQPLAERLISYRFLYVFALQVEAKSTEEVGRSSLDSLLKRRD